MERGRKRGILCQNNKANKQLLPILCAFIVGVVVVAKFSLRTQISIIVFVEKGRFG